MRTPRPALVAAVSLSMLGVAGCGDRAPTPPPAPSAAPAATPAGPPMPAAPPATPPAAPAGAPAAPPPRTEAPQATPRPAPPPPPKAEAKPAPHEPAPVAKVPPAPPREKVGASKCRACHRLQYDSWVKSGHARKALDCEGCHGNGSEYATMKVMKDPAAAKAAGLIFQTAAFCEKCHPTADASYLPKAHAHRKK